VVWFDDSRGIDAGEVGGKFANLVRLSRAGARVPPGFAITTFAYRKFMQQIGSQVASVLENLDADDIAAVERASAKITELVMATPVPDDVSRSIKGAYAELTKKERDAKDVPVAVRSSATAEDMLTASVAGQHETFLWIRGAESVVERVKQCWASAFATRSLSYRKARRISQVGLEMGAVVQKMVVPRKSGVMFTLNPANGDPSKITIDATWGLGEAEVSGVVTPDLYVVDKVTMEILTKNVGSKQVEFVVEGDRVEQKEVPKERRDVLCLTDEEVLELARAGKSLEKAFGKPQDIEWAIEGSSKAPEALNILQARPETVWSGKGGPKTSQKGALDMMVDKLKRGERIE